MKLLVVYTVILEILTLTNLVKTEEGETCTSPPPAPSVDTTKPGATGLDVTKAAYDEVINTGILGNDHQFLLTLGMAETNGGRVLNRDPAGRQGGPFGARPSFLNTIQNKLGLNSDVKWVTKVENLEAELDLDFRTTELASLGIPRVSGATVAAYVSSLANVLPIPANLNLQAGIYAQITTNFPNGKRIFFKAGLNLRFSFDPSCFTFTRDPHVKQRLLGSEKPLCYDISGDEGNMFTILEDSEQNIKINIEITELGAGPTFSPYIGALAIFSEQQVIIVNEDSTEIDGDSFPWEERVVPLRTADSHGNIEIDQQYVNVTLPSWYISVQKSHFLDLSMMQSEPDSGKWQGIIGDMNTRARIEETGTEAKLVITNNDAPRSTVQLEARAECWKLPLKFSAPKQILGKIVLENKVDCMTC